MFRAPGNGPIARLSKEELERYEAERLRQRFESCPFGPDSLSENYPFLHPSFRFRFSSAEEVRRAELFPGVDGRQLLQRLQPKYDPLRAPRMMEEQRSHLESLVIRVLDETATRMRSHGAREVQENKYMRSLCFLGSISGHDAHNSRGDIVVEPETLYGQLPRWHDRAELDERLRVIDWRIRSVCAIGLMMADCSPVSFYFRPVSFYFPSIPVILISVPHAKTCKLRIQSYLQHLPLLFCRCSAFLPHTHAPHPPQPHGPFVFPFPNNCWRAPAPQTHAQAHTAGARAIHQGICSGTSSWRAPSSSTDRVEHRGLRYLEVSAQTSYARSHVRALFPSLPSSHAPSLTPSLLTPFSLSFLHTHACMHTRMITHT